MTPPPLPESKKSMTVWKVYVIAASLLAPAAVLFNFGHIFLLPKLERLYSEITILENATIRAIYNAVTSFQESRSMLILFVAVAIFAAELLAKKRPAIRGYLVYGAAWIVAALVISHVLAIAVLALLGAPMLGADS